MADNRSVILNCSLQLFADRGYDAVGVQQIVEAAGVSKPTLYHYFGSKSGLLEALMGEHFSGFLSQLEVRAAYSGDLPKTLYLVVESYFRFALEHPTLYRLHLAAWFANPESEASRIISPVISHQHRILETLFQQAAKDHGNMQGRQQVYAATFLGMINTYIVQAFHHEMKLGQETIQQAVQQFSYGIYS